MNIPTLTPALFLLLSTALSAQTPDTLRILARATPVSGSEIWVRWAPADIATWRFGNVHGYRVVRYATVKDGQVLTLEEYQGTETAFDPLYLLTENEWEAMADTSDLAGIAAGSIYGDSLDLLPASGGTMLNVYNKSKELETRFGWSLFAADQDFNIAKAMGLGFADNTVQENWEYVYFVEPYELQGGEIVEKGFAQATAATPEPLPQPENLGYTPADRGALIQWDPGISEFSSFDIQRYDDESDSFVKVNTSPVVYVAGSSAGSLGQASFFDSLADNSTTYIYRVVGRNPFGQMSPPSDTLHVKGQHPRLDFTWHIDTVMETEHYIDVAWVFPAALESQITGFEVLRGDDTEGPFERISGANPLGAGTRTFRDNNPHPSNYYLLRTTDLNDYAYATFTHLGQLVDLTPPEAPLWVQGVCDASGLVHLNWAASTSADVMGYRVFTSNVQTGDFQQATSRWVADTFFNDVINLKTLTEQVWYGVKAIDRHQNQSAMSAPAMVQRPDIVPPSPPIITNHTASGNAVVFQFEMSSSSDVVKYIFERKLPGTPNWEALTSFPASAPQYQYADASGDKRRWYEYRLLAEDEAKLRSSSVIVRTKKLDDGMRAPVQNFQAQPFNNSTYVGLSWEYPIDPDLIGFEVYRAVQDSAKKRSYVFVPYPQGSTNNPAFTAGITLNGNTASVNFTDFDISFDAPQLNTFQFFGTPDMNINQSVVDMFSTTYSGTYTVPNPNNLAGQNSTQIFLHYWVIAKFADGGMSPFAGPLTVQVQ